jgi:PAS domain S-box-containing protein
MTRRTVAEPHGDNRSASELMTELRATRENLRRLEDQYRATIEQLPVGIAHSDADHRFTRVNAKFCSMLGYPENELVGKAVAELNHPDDLQHSATVMQPVLHGDVNFFTFEKRYIKKDGTTLWGRITVAPSRDASGALDGTLGVLEDIGERKAAEAEVDRIQRELLRASHQAGMAEVASNVLHNVGNVLNSVNVSATVLKEKIRSAKVDSLARGAALLVENADGIAAFLSEDDRGKHLPDFFVQLSSHMLRNQQAALAELDSLTQSIEHIKSIVASQQAYAKRCGVTATVDVAKLVEDSLAMNRGAFSRHGVTLTRAFEEVPKITVDAHKVLQILVNLERNAKYACEASEHRNKNITVRISQCDLGVQIQVIDDGVGISPEYMPRLFIHGFTTKAEGHGFGLHSGALAAKELGGTLEAASEGLGHGATFTLTLPLTPPGT